MTTPNTLHLGQTWHIDRPLAAGGFGAVYVAHDDEGHRAAVKLVPKATGADRELLFADLADARNVVPIIDCGDHGNHWVLVMPLAECSLRDRLNQGHPATDEALAILVDIATAVSDLDGRVVHRDLKPENVLLLDGHWCLADFGIARYTEASTAADTHKYSMTAQYAAPEQWRHERATAATDIYATGIIAYELLTGHRPFDGSSDAEFRDQHLHADPPPLSGVAPTVTALVDECLYKSPAARPTAENLLRRLERAARPPATPGLQRLAAANQQTVARQSEAARSASVAQTNAERRRSLYKDSARSLQAIADELQHALLSAAPAAVQRSSREVLIAIELGDGRLTMSTPKELPLPPWGGGRPAFDVIASARLQITQSANHYGHTGRSHALWYCDAITEHDFAWYEVGFAFTFFAKRVASEEPFALEPNEEAGRALTSVAAIMPAWNFTRLHAGDVDDLIDRWGGWVALAANGQLHRPGTIPEVPIAQNWRRS